MSTIDQAKRLGLIIADGLVRPNGKNVPGVLLSKKQSLTIHETDNHSAGANARFHRNWVAAGGGKELASFTYCVDSTGAINIVDEAYESYHSGVPYGHQTSNGVELCVNSDGDWHTTLDNAAKLAAAWCIANQKDVSAIIPHNIWYGKDCPYTIRHTPGGWLAFLQSVQGYIHQLGG